MDAAPLVLTAAEVAARFRKSTDWFYDNRRKLEKKGFPKGLPGVRGRWSAAAVDRWIGGEMPGKTVDDQAAREARRLVVDERIALLAGGKV